MLVHSFPLRKAAEILGVHPITLRRFPPSPRDWLPEDHVAYFIDEVVEQPDHWTIAAFRRRHHRALGDLFVQTVKLAQRAGLVKLGHVSLDGTKIKAYASKHSAMSYGRMNGGG